MRLSHARQNLEAAGVGHAPDDLDCPLAEFGEGVQQLIAGIGAVGEEVAQPGKEIVDRRDDQRSTVAVLHVGGVDFGSDHQAGLSWTPKTRQLVKVEPCP